MPKSLKLILYTVGVLVVLPEVVPIGLICLLVYAVKKGWQSMLPCQEKE